MREIECKKWWSKHLPDAPPLAHILRQTYQPRWLRIHSLPESKRYPETEAEYAELLFRHNTVATEVLGVGSPCFLIRAFYCYEPSEGDSAWSFELADDKFSFEVEEVEWGFGQFNELLREVADDLLTRKILFASRTIGAIYAPV